MSGSSDIDSAIRRVRETFDRAVEDAEAMSEKARREVEDAVDDLEEHIDRLRDRE